MSPVRGVKRELSCPEEEEEVEEGEISAEDMVRPRFKRLRATDFIDMDHYP